MHRTLSRAISLALALAISGAGMAASAQESGTQDQSAAASPSNSSATPVELPDSPGKVNAGSSSAPQGNSTANSAQSAQSPQPSGTAVAPPVQVSGGAASKPAGVAIAPPKQRQVRSLLLKLGLIAGAGVAIGTVVGLSEASPGRVPNSGR